MIDNGKKEQIAHQVIKTLFIRFESFPEDSLSNRNAPFHEAFLNAFADKLEGKVTDIPIFISLSSWLHGLNTTLGQSFFENVAHILSDSYKKKFTSKTNTNLKVSQEQRQVVDDIYTDLKNGTQTPNVDREDRLVFSLSLTPDLIAKDFTVDVFIESESRIVAIELKSVRPNKGEMAGEKHKILEAKAAFHNEYVGRGIKYFIGFPFDPTSDTHTGCDKVRFLDYLVEGRRFFDPSEILLADELWNFLSDDNNTMKQMLEIINTIATPQFQDRYNYLNSSKNRLNDAENYRRLLNKWFLCNEVTLFDNNDTILGRLAVDSRGERIYNQPIFKDGEYNLSRYNFLRSLII